MRGEEEFKAGKVYDVDQVTCDRLCRKGALIADASHEKKEKESSKEADKLAKEEADKLAAEKLAKENASGKAQVKVDSKKQTSKK